MRSALFATLMLLALPACRAVNSPKESTALQPLSVSLVSMYVDVDGVNLVWSVKGADGRQFEIMRQNRSEPWKHFATRVPVNDMIAYQDAGVVPGQTYRYRLRILGSARDKFLNEVEVQVPILPPD
ncbi:MAG TPA: hypothetical protein VN896_02870 [Methylomirabilota bacterium]|jgi:hypothetical protein|nr:hypothetical protein [Methylomirabilota bacterium]